MKVSKVPFGLGALVALSGSAHAAVLNAGGEGLQVDVGTDLSVQVSRDDQPQLAGPGLVASVDGRLIGSGIDGASPWMPVWQSQVTGDGSVQQPYQVDTIIGVDGVEVLATVRYVTGAEQVQLALHVDAAEGAVVRLYHLIDTGPSVSGVTYWRAAAGLLGFRTATAQVELVAADWSHYHAGEYGMPAQSAAADLDLDDEVDAAEGPRSLGIEWTHDFDAWPTELAYELRFAVPDPGTSDDGGGSGHDPVEPVDGSGSDDADPPPIGTHAAGAAVAAGGDDEEPTISDDGDEDTYDSATDDAAGCSAGGHGASGGVSLLLIGLAVGCLGRRGRGARAARRGTR